MVNLQQSLAGCDGSSVLLSRTRLGRIPSQQVETARSRPAVPACSPNPQCPGFGESHVSVMRAVRCFWSNVRL